MNKVSKATVTTLRDADAVLPSFVHYHLHIGFDHLFLFFDDPTANIPAWIQAHPNISAFARNEALEDAWSTTSSYLKPQISRSIETEAMSRQILNAELALREAYYKNVDWLLHLDVDELFYPEGTTLDAHFQRMEAMGVECVWYPNLEGATEKETCADFFKEVTLFKVNPEDKTNAARIANNGSFLQQITQIPASYFHYYTSHKSAARVTPNTVPKGVHNFSVSQPGKRKKVIEGPFILHYPCCGINHFIQKYKTLGNFGDRWFGKGTQTPIYLASHLNGRDIVGTANEEAIAAYYRDNFVFSEPALVEALIQRGLCRRISEPSAFLNSHKYA